MTIDQKIEALLFFKGEPVSLKNLCVLLEATEDEVRTGIEQLGHALESRGLTLITHNESFELRTRKEAAHILEALRKDELTQSLGKAGAETLAIVLYNGPLARSSIDYIRGVNSTFILRNLLVRGLVERVPNPLDSRSYLYQPTVELLAHLGVSSVEMLPEYKHVQKELAAFMSTEDEASSEI